MRFTATRSICALLCGLVLVLGACELDVQPALRVGAIIWPGYEPLHLARAAGRPSDAGFRFIDFPSAVEVTRAYRNRVLDVAAMTADEALTVASLEPGRHRIFLVADFSNGGDVIIAQREFAAMSQLKGHRIGVESNALAAYVLLRALQVRGLSKDDVQAVAVPHEQQLTAFKNHAIDAIVSYEPNRSRLMALGGNEVFNSREIPGEVVDVLIARAEALESQRDAFVALTKAWFAGVEALRRGDARAISTAAAHEDVEPEAFKASLQAIELLDRERNLRLLSSGPEGLATPLERLAQTMMAGGLVSSEIHPASMLDRSIVELAQP